MDVDYGQIDWKRYAATARKAAAEGAVLLRNEKRTLPFQRGERIAVFGRIQTHYYKSGTGSGGLVNAPYVVGILEALENCGSVVVNSKVREVYRSWEESHPFVAGKEWATDPWSQEEMELEESLVEEAAAESDAALVILGRTAGEDRDNSALPGSYLLTDLEYEMLRKVCRAFEKVAVVLNVGNIIDMKWVEELKPSAVLYAWQGGQEGGNAVADVLTGAVNPCGHLPDSIAYTIQDYPSANNFGDPRRAMYQEDIYVGYRYFQTFAPEKVLYPFGFGLSYTSFQTRLEKAAFEDGSLHLDVEVKNVGETAGKEVVQIYLEKPQGTLGQPKRVLVGFEKTASLEPGESQVISLEISSVDMASYDDGANVGCGRRDASAADVSCNRRDASAADVSCNRRDVGAADVNRGCLLPGHPYSWVMEAGEYGVCLGENVRDAKPVFSFSLQDALVIEQCGQALAPVEAFQRLRNVGGKPVYEPVPIRGYSLAERMLTDPVRKRPASDFVYTGDLGYRLEDVGKGKVSMEAFLAQLTDEDLSHLAKGEGMNSPKVTPGTASACGGLTERLKAFGIPALCCADGPSGIRMDCGTQAFSLPNGTCLAGTFDKRLNEELFSWVGLELRRNRVDILLGPGMNLHRNPLNGRNFEYFSEDPLLTGRMAAAQLCGLAARGVTGSIKHFAGNNQEFGRFTLDSQVSERALRELYLKSFEIAVKEGHAFSIMTTYGAINGIWTAGNYDLVTQILRKEWGYDGMVMTDWWAGVNEEGEEPVRGGNLHAMVRAQNDLFMVVPDTVKYEDDILESLKKGLITRGELLRNAANICGVILRLPCGKGLRKEQKSL